MVVLVLELERDVKLCFHIFNSTSPESFVAIRY